MSDTMIAVFVRLVHPYFVFLLTHIWELKFNTPKARAILILQRITDFSTTGSAGLKRRNNGKRFITPYIIKEIKMPRCNVYRHSTDQLQSMSCFTLIVGYVLLYLLLRTISLLFTFISFYIKLYYLKKGHTLREII